MCFLFSNLNCYPEVTHRWLYYIGNLNSSANFVDMKILSRSDHRRVGPEQHRCLRVYGLFGGKKDNNEKSDDAPSKVSQYSLLFLSMLSVNINFNILLHPLTYLLTFYLIYISYINEGYWVTVLVKSLFGNSVFGFVLLFCPNFVSLIQTDCFLL